MTRDVTCNLVNNTPYSLSTTSWHLDHGKPTQGPISVNPNTGSTQVFYFTKTEGSAHGVTGRVVYGLDQGVELYLAFNCPFAQDGQGGLSNCFFYAGLTNMPSNSGTQYYVDLDVQIGSSSPNATDPPNADKVTATVTLNLA